MTARPITSGPDDLYALWQRQKWSLDDWTVNRDPAQWAKMRPFARSEILNIVVQLCVGEAVVVDTLGPIVDAAPDEASRRYLQTQVEDESRHTRFFVKWCTAVGAFDPDTDVVDSCRAEMPANAARLLDDALRSEVRKLEEAPHDIRQWYRTVGLYHVLIEGVAELGAFQALRSLLKNLDCLPDLREGLIRVVRDESRHVAFGVSALRQAVVDGYKTDVIRACWDYLPTLVHVLVNPERRNPLPLFPALIEARAAELETQWRRIESAFRTRLLHIGLQDEADLFTQMWAQNVELALQRHRDLHGSHHPVAYLRRQGVPQDGCSKNQHSK